MIPDTLALYHPDDGDDDGYRYGDYEPPSPEEQAEAEREAIRIEQQMRAEYIARAKVTSWKSARSS